MADSGHCSPLSTKYHIVLKPDWCGDGTLDTTYQGEKSWEDFQQQAKMKATYSVSINKIIASVGRDLKRSSGPNFNEKGAQRRLALHPITSLKPPVMGILPCLWESCSNKCFLCKKFLLKIS